MLNCTVMTFVERVVAFYRFVSCIEPIDVTEGSYLKSAVKKIWELTGEWRTMLKWVVVQIYEDCLF